MEYNYFLKEFANFSADNYTILREGHNACAVCFDYHIQLRELVGVINIKISAKQDASDNNQGIMNYFDLHSALIIITTEENGICSHLIELIGSSMMDSTDAYSFVKEAYICAKKVLGAKDKEAAQHKESL